MSNLTYKFDYISLSTLNLIEVYDLYYWFYYDKFIIHVIGEYAGCKHIRNIALPVIILSNKNFDIRLPQHLYNKSLK